MTNNAPSKVGVKIAVAAIGLQAFWALIFGTELPSSHATPLPACHYEDGNPDGKPCMWTSPRTGKQYYNDGSNYR